jgi:hypothetical protein
MIILYSFGIFSCFGIMCQEKSGNPTSEIVGEDKGAFCFLPGCWLHWHHDYFLTSHSIKNMFFIKLGLLPNIALHIRSGLQSFLSQTKDEGLKGFGFIAGFPGSRGLGQHQHARGAPLHQLPPQPDRPSAPALVHLDPAGGPEPLGQLGRSGENRVFIFNCQGEKNIQMNIA